LGVIGLEREMSVSRSTKYPALHSHLALWLACRDRWGGEEQSSVTEEERLVAA
jgi:hypothetical protein